MRNSAIDAAPPVACEGHPGSMYCELELACDAAVDGGRRRSRRSGIGIFLSRQEQEFRMFFRQNRLQYHAKPERPDPVYAKQLQEVLGGQWGEISVMMTYLFQGWNCRGPAKYRDMIMDIGTEEIGHVEMLATMIARLLETSPVETREEAAKDSVIGAAMGGARIEDAIVAGMNPQHVIVTGCGAAPTDSVGYPWTARYTIASRNLLADFRFNVTAESQGRLQVSRLYQLTDDPRARHALLPPGARHHAPEPVARCDQGARGGGAR